MPSRSACPEDERMFGTAFGVAVLLALMGSVATQGCVAPHQLVSEIVQRLEASIQENKQPNPSILLALNLAGAAGGNTHKWLLEQIQEDAVERAEKGMTSGEVALSVLALLSSCQNPQRVEALGETLDLIRVLQEKMDEEMASLEANGVPKTTLFSVSLDTLGLCLAEVSGHQGAAVVLAKEVLSPESSLSVDTRAMAALAMACTYGQMDLHDVQDLLQTALSVVTNSFLDEQEKGNGMIGNIYSMGLALQALEATRTFYAPREWDCTQAFSVVYSHEYQQPMAIAQVLPALVGRSYLDTASLDCNANTSMSQTPQLTPTSELRMTTVLGAAPIIVVYSIINELQGEPFDFTTQVMVPAGSTLLQVMEAAVAEKPNIFSFQTEPTSWGPMVVSIHGLAANADDRTYWQFFSSGNALQEGVGTYKPQDGSHIQAVFSTY